MIHRALLGEDWSMPIGQIIGSSRGGLEDFFTSCAFEHRLKRLKPVRNAHFAWEGDSRHVPSAYANVRHRLTGGTSRRHENFWTEQNSNTPLTNLREVI